MTETTQELINSNRRIAASLIRTANFYADRIARATDGRKIRGYMIQKARTEKAAERFESEARCIESIVGH